MVSTLTPSAVDTACTAQRPRRRRSNPYPLWFFAIPAVLFIVFFAIPTFSSFYFSLTRWTLQTTQFIGLENFVLFFNEPTLVSWLHPHLHLRLPHLGGEGGARHSAGPGTDLPHHRPRLPPLGGVLPGAGLHHRGRVDIQDLDGPVQRADQQNVGGGRHHRPRLAHRPQPRPLLGDLGRHLERRRHRHLDLHRRHGRHPPGILRSRQSRRLQRPANVSSTSPCPCSNRPPSPWSPCP